MFKYFLGFDPQKLNTSFNYTMKNALLYSFKKDGISFTSDINDDFEEAIVPSGVDCFSYYAAFKKKKNKINIIATSSMSDFATRRTKNGVELILSLDAVNFYRKANNLFIYLPSQTELIEKAKIKTDVKKMPIITQDYISDLTPCQRDAFLSNYRLQGNRDIIIAYGLLTNKDTVMDLRAIARNCPEKDFLFFGEVTNDALKQTLLESITQPNNIHFYNHLPEELYPSFLCHCKQLLLVGDYLSFPQVMIDCIYHRIPITTYKLSGYEEILNENDVNIAKLYSQLYDVINKETNKQKIENAYQTIEKLKISNALHTKKEKTTIL